MSNPHSRINTLLGIAALIAGFAGAFLLLGPAGRIPLMDANRVLLAETPAEAFCSADALFSNSNQETYDLCVEESGESSEVDLTLVLPAFCRGVIASGWPGTMNDCLSVTERDQLWPTKELGPTGWLSNAWNKAFPWPGSLTGMGTHNSDESRTGERDGTLRDGDITR